MKMTGMAWLVLSSLLADTALAQDEREIPLSDAPGVRFSIATSGPAGDPAERITAARDAMAARLGPPIAHGDIRSMPQQGATFASLSERFQRDPETIHSWMTSNMSGIMCHFVTPRRADIIAPFRVALERCGAILLGKANGPPSAAAPAPAPPPAGRPSTVPPSDAALKAAIAAVPAANRPIAIAMRNGISFDGTFAMPKAYPWMLFANGWAVDCANWDPATVSPTPEALRAPPYKCKVDRWRRSAGGYEFEKAPGSWEKAAPSALLAFKPGQRVTVDLVNKSGFGAPVGAPGLSITSLTSGQLRMSNTGEIATGSWTSVVVSGDNVGGGSSGRRGPAIGTYYLDGHLIAIADPQGGIRRGFIAEDDGKGGPYIYLNGDLFWPKDR